MPFLIWNVGAFVYGTLIFPSSLYPIDGIGAGQLLLSFNVIPSPDAAFPFWVLELIVGVPVLLWLLRYLHTHLSLRVMMATSTAFVFVTAFCNRMFNDNYVGFVIALGVIAWFLPKDDRLGLDVA